MSTSVLSDIFTVGGLVIDLIGAIVLVRGLIITEDQAAELSGARFDKSPPIGRGPSESSVDPWVY
jgi:hypothetical protein